MEGFDKREYHAVILGALLHDIGKFLHRARGKHHISHQEVSFEFIRKISENLATKELYDLELVGVLVRYHHGGKKSTKKRVLTGDPYIKGLDDKDKLRLWDLIRIVRRADVYSCYERDHTPNWRGGTKRLAPLDSVFSNLALEPRPNAERKNLRYHLTGLDPLKAFPEDFPTLDEEELAGFIEEFEKSVGDFAKLTRFEDVLTRWLNILQAFTWAVPSDTRYEHSDVSLFDHLRSTAAIAACLYRHHLPNIGSGRFPTANEFIFIGGDFSGIQDYIFHITNRGSGGASKRLRARSLFISLFTETVIHRILHELGLPLVCNLFSAAGKFLLIAPYHEGAEEILKELKHEIEGHIHRTYFSQFSFLMDWNKIEQYKQKFHILNFYKTAEEMFHLLETQKRNKALTVFQDRELDTWNPEAFKATELYESYTETGDCPICGRGPALTEEKEKEQGEEPVKCCLLCLRDKHDIGEKLPRARYVAFGRGKIDDSDKTKKIVTLTYGSGIESYKKECYFFELLPEHHQKPEYYLVYDIRPELSGPFSGSALPIMKKHIANHIPTDENKKTLDFARIGSRSIWKKGDRNYGSPFLGILKADIDNLGLLFSKGFENPVDFDEKKLATTDRKTVSRYLTFSRMVELFMSGWINTVVSMDNPQALLYELLDEKEIDRDRFQNYLQRAPIDFRDIYTVYSGGDDLVLVGPWEAMILFSIVLYHQFRKFTCNNPDVTLSAGLAFVKPKHPIASAIRQADDLLKRSKEKRKNKLTLFGITMAWDSFPEIVDFFLFIDEKINDGASGVNKAFVYRLLEYHREASKFVEKGHIPALKFLSALSYDIGRNIVKWNHNREIIKGLEESQRLQPLLTQKPDRTSLIYTSRVPLSWALYRDRE